MKNCKQCGQPMASDAPEGLCARCLLSVAIKEPNVAQASPPVGITGGTPVSHPDFPDIGDPAEIARRLPQFEILKLLGRGGMGVVYQARQINLDRIVALKILPPLDAMSPDFVERFRREARSLAKLSHPNIVGVHEFGESGGLYFLAMEFVDGANLREVQRARRMTPAEALAVVPKICDALQFAHEEGVVHRDIKPENILIDKRGRVKIADFGLAKLLRRDQADHTLTGTGMTLGTPRYMAPEQLDRPETVDHRADIYSLGVVFYEMLTGEVPMGRFAPPSEKVQIDVKLDEIVLHALERDADRRYQHASQVRDDVENVTSQPQAKTPPTPPPIPATAPPDDFLLCHPRLPRMAQAITAYCLLIVPWFWLAQLFNLKFTSDAPGHLIYSVADILSSVVLAVGALIAGAMKFVGGIKLRKLNLHGAVLIRSAIWLSIVLSVLAILSGALLGVVRGFMEAAGQAQPLVFTAGLALGMGLQGMVVAFEITALVWLHRNHQRLAEICRPA